MVAVAEVMVQAGKGSILVLFDIDGTLIDSRGAGVRGMSRAFLDVHGWPGALDDVPIAGRTDRAILGDVFRRQGVEDWEALLGTLRDAYLGVLPHELSSSGGAAMVLPGVTRTLDVLGADDRFTVGLLTGNFVEGARLKLQAAGVWERFVLGAYGDDFVNRRDLVPVAVERAKALGAPPEGVIVIGDTPLDVDCAQAHGAVAVAVATGHYNVDALRATGAELVVGTLAEIEAVAETFARLATVAGPGLFEQSDLGGARPLG
jgi:phosphoglycolate phosphatase-like HAD superfamily hydrolase